MAYKVITANETWATGVIANRQYNMLAYEGNLGGGTLEVWTDNDGCFAPVSDSRLSAATLDSNGQVVRQMTFWTVGTVSVILSGAAGANVEVSLT